MDEENQLKVEICGSRWRGHTCLEASHVGHHIDRATGAAWTDSDIDPDYVVIDNAWLLRFVEEKAAKMVAVARAKNADYAGASSDPFGNFARVEDLGIATVEQGFLTRMTDKLCRIASLARPGVEAQVKDEAIEDTLLDLANYSLLLAAWLAAKRLRAEGKTVP